MAECVGLVGFGLLMSGIRASGFEGRLSTPRIVRAVVGAGIGYR
jgi:hypothetical protein